MRHRARLRRDLWVVLKRYYDIRGIDIELDRDAESVFRGWMENDLDKDSRRRLVNWIENSPEDIILETEKMLEKALSLAEHQPTGSRIGRKQTPPRPPFNAEYLLYLLLRRDEWEIVIGDLLETYGQILVRFNKRRANIWFYKQVVGSLFPLLRRALLRIGALVWLGRILRRLVS